jgi:predicted nucleic acid-binding protein
MTGYTLDTNIVTAHLKRNPLVRQRIRQGEVAKHLMMLNAVSYYETKRGLLFADAQTQLAVFGRLWQAQGKQHEALNMLSEIYGWFTEGFETKDLQEAKALRHDLA